MQLWAGQSTAATDERSNLLGIDPWAFITTAVASHVLDYRQKYIAP